MLHFSCSPFHKPVIIHKAWKLEGYYHVNAESGFSIAAEVAIIWQRIIKSGGCMSAELSLLFLEKRVEAARLSAAVTEPYATGAEPAEAARLAEDFKHVAQELEQSLAALNTLNDGLLKDKALDQGGLRHVRGRISTAVGEVARAAQDFAAQIRFFEAMNPADSARTKPALDMFEAIAKATRELTVPEAPEEGAELAPADETGLNKDEEVDPMMM
jgi:hypothetical protein